MPHPDRDARSDDAQSLGARTDAPEDRSARPVISDISENNGGAARRVQHIAASRQFLVFHILVLSVPLTLTVADCCARRFSPVCPETEMAEQDLRNVNDPSAGSPTETLLRLLLPLNDQVWSSSRQHRQCRDIAAHQSEDLTKSFNR
ncbi:hypothetical protein P5V15_015339 [Pogonomyrmex californicus]